MAESYKSVNADLGTTADTSVYQCPSATTAVVLLCQIANVDGSANVRGARPEVRVPCPARSLPGSANDDHGQYNDQKNIF